MSNIGFIGIGKLGLECAEACAEKGHSVYGYDVEQKPVRKVIQQQTIEDTVKDRDIVFVAVPTPHDPKYDGRAPCMHLEPKDFSYDIVKSVLTEANKHMNENQILVLISTVLPGTVRKEFVPLITNTKFVYNPYLIAMGTVAWDMVNPDMVIIGGEKPNDDDAMALIDFYKTIMENDPHYNIGTWEEAEATKIFYNTFISARLSLVNMIQDVAQRTGNMNVDVVTESLRNAGKRITSDAYMKAGMGDGGPCHPRDNIALRHLAERLNLGYDLFDAIAKSREVQAENMAREILKYGNRVQFSSDSYKSNVEYTDGSYSLLVQYFIKEFGGWVVDENPSVYVLVHPGDKPIDNIMNFDPWRNHKGDNIIRYGDTR